MATLETSLTIPSGDDMEPSPQSDVTRQDQAQTYRHRPKDGKRPSITLAYPTEFPLEMLGSDTVSSPEEPKRSRADSECSLGVPEVDPQQETSWAPVQSSCWRLNQAIGISPLLFPPTHHAHARPYW